MSAVEREVEARKVAAVVAAVQAYLDSEIRGGQAEPAAIRFWRRDVNTDGSGVFIERHRSWTGRK